jgi:hypothetical protein
MVVVLSFIVILSPLLYAVLLTSRLAIRTKLIAGAAVFLLLITLPMLAIIFNVGFGL